MVQITDELLIESVKQYPFLYDTAHQYFHDTLKRDNAWIEISDKFDKCSALDCKKRWTALRDSYRKSLKKRRILREQGAVREKHWKYEGFMDFLIPYINERSTRSNASTLESINPENESSGHSPEFNQDYHDVKYAYLEPSSHEYIPQNANDILNANYTGNESSATQRGESSEEKDLKRCLTELTETMNNYMETKKCKKDAIQADPLASFFRAMEQTVRTFHYSLQIEVKSKISSLVSEYEAKNFQSNI